MSTIIHKLLAVKRVYSVGTGTKMRLLKTKDESQINQAKADTIIGDKAHEIQMSDNRQVDSHKKGVNVPQM